MSPIDTQPVNCRHCIHYYITWEPQHPYGCKAMGFKGKVLPSITVFRSTGKQCMLFKKSVKKAK